MAHSDDRPERRPDEKGLQLDRTVGLWSLACLALGGAMILAPLIMPAHSSGNSYSFFADRDETQSNITGIVLVVLALMAYALRATREDLRNTVRPGHAGTCDGAA